MKEFAWDFLVSSGGVLALLLAAYFFGVLGCFLVGCVLWVVIFGTTKK